MRAYALTTYSEEVGYAADVVGYLAIDDEQGVGFAEFVPAMPSAWNTMWNDLRKTYGAFVPLHAIEDVLEATNGITWGATPLNDDEVPQAQSASDAAFSLIDHHLTVDVGIAPNES